jgi:uncharacterized protein YqjF (DUF2071 family)
MVQTWERITFLHWPYVPSEVARLLPPGLEPDLWDGRAWVGFTPFVAGVRPPFGPDWTLRFPETNVRTYVRGPDGQRGVWFFSLDASRFSAVIGARALYRLPYQWSRMRVEYDGRTVVYRSNRKWPEPGPHSEIEVEPGSKFGAGEEGPLDHFLTARFRLYTLLRRGYGFAQVEHPPWPLHRARVLRLNQSLVSAAGLPHPAREPLVHYSPGVEVRVGFPRALT